MKKISLIFILVFTLTIFLSGCSVFNLSNFVLPNDIDFINTIENNDTPKKICSYIKENFTFKENLYYSPDPYELWLNPFGDCNDFVTYALFGANYHGYETWQIHIFYYGEKYSHFIAIFNENNEYTFLNTASSQYYFSKNCKTFLEIVEIIRSPEYNDWSKYIVYDYNMNLIEKVQK